MMLRLPCETNPSLPALYVAHGLQAASRFIGSKIDLMEASGIQYLELAATADFLLAIQSYAPLFTRLKQKGINEAKSGADFEWWVGAGPLWLGMRIQAKRHFRQDTSGRVDYYGDLARTNKNGRQVDLLINDSVGRGLVPLHMFFESRTNASPSRVAKCGHPLPDELWGVSIADSYAIQGLVEASTLSGNDVRTVLQPVSCLPVCAGSSWSLMDRVMYSIRKHVWTEKRRDSSFPEPKQLPPYVQRLLEQPDELVTDLQWGLDAILVTSEGPFG